MLVYERPSVAMLSFKESHRVAQGLFNVSIQVHQKSPVK